MENETIIRELEAEREFWKNRAYTLSEYITKLKAGVNKDENLQSPSEE